MINPYLKAQPVLSVFFISLFFRFFYTALFVSPEHLTGGDQLIYLSMAGKVAEGGIFSLEPERVPGYPLFLRLIHLFASESSWISFIQAVVDSLTCVVIGLLAVRIFGIGLLLAGLLSAVNLNMVILSAMVLTDSLFLLLFVVSLLFAVKFLNKPRFKDYILCIGLLALATMVRSATYYLIPLALVGMAVFGVYAGIQLSRMFGYFLAGLLLAMVVLAPQHLRNWQQYGSSSFVSQSGSHVLGWVVPAVYQYSGKGSYQEGQILTRSRLDQALKAEGLSELPANPFASSQFSTKVAKSVLQELGAVAVVKAWAVGAAINMVVPSAAFAPVVRAMDHPSFYATPGNGALEKIWNYVTDGSGALYLSILATGTLSSLAFFLLYLGGWWVALRDRVRFPRSVFVLLTLIILYFLGITGPIIGSKYRLPIEPVMTVFVTYAILRLTDQWKAR